MKHSYHHFSLFMITFLLTLLMLPFFVKADWTDPVSGIYKEVTISTFGKQITDLQVLYTPDIFAMSLGSTTNDVFGSIAKILEFYATGATP